MSWDWQFTRARRAGDGRFISVNKSEIGPIPPGFETSSLAVDGLFGKYHRRRGNEVITIWELPTQYYIKIGWDNSLTLDLEQYAPHLPGNGTQEQSRSTYSPSLDDRIVAAAIIGGLTYIGAKELKRRFRSDQRTYRVFISHSWEYSDQIERLEQFLNSADGFDWHDYSVWGTDPLDAPTDAELKQALQKQIKPASVVLVLSGMYTAHSRWIAEEIRIANQMSKPIIGILPWGNERVPRAVRDNAVEIVGWNTNSIVRAIEEYSP